MQEKNQGKHKSNKLIIHVRTISKLFRRISPIIKFGHSNQTDNTLLFTFYPKPS